MPHKEQNVDNALIGAAGVHFVVSELSFRGLIALPTIRNTAGYDVIVVSPDGLRHANLQVKTSKNKVSFWPVGKKYKDLKGEKNFFVFARYLKNESRFEVFLEYSEAVIKQVTNNLSRAKRQGYAPWSPCWYLPTDADEINRVQKQWKKFGRVCAV